MERSNSQPLRTSVAFRLPIDSYRHQLATTLDGKPTLQLIEKRPGLQFHFDRISEYVVVKIVHESTLLKLIPLEQLCRLVHQATVDSQSHGIAPSTSNHLPVRAIVDSPRLAVWFHGDNGSLHVVQVKFNTTSDFDTAMSILRQLGCPELQYRAPTARSSAHQLNRSYTMTMVPSSQQDAVMRPPFHYGSLPGSESIAGFSSDTGYSTTMQDVSSLCPTPIAAERVNAATHTLNGRSFQRSVTSATPCASREGYFTRPSSNECLETGQSSAMHALNVQQAFLTTATGQQPGVSSTAMEQARPTHNSPWQTTSAASGFNGDFGHQPLSAGNGSLQPSRPYTAPVDSGLPMGITPYLPPKRALPFARPNPATTPAVADMSRPLTADETASIVVSRGPTTMEPPRTAASMDSSRPPTARPSTSADVPDHAEPAQRPHTAASIGSSTDGHQQLAHAQQLCPTSSTISFRVNETGMGDSDPLRPSSSIAPPTFLSARSAPSVSNYSSSPPRPQSTSVVSTAQPGSNLDYHVSGSAILPAFAMMSGTQHAGEAWTAAETPAQATNITDSASASTTQGTKRPLSTATGNSPPKKRAPAKKRAFKSTNSSTAPAATQRPDVNALLQDYFKDFNVDTSLQNFMERPRSGRQDFVNELICRYLNSDAFVTFAEHVENAWCRIGLEHPDSNMERRRVDRERGNARN